MDQPLALQGAVWLLFVLLLISLLWWRLSRTAVYEYRPLDRRTWGLTRSYRIRPEAERRAEALLRSVLSADEYQHLSRRGYLEVRSQTFGSRVYLVPETQGPVTVYEGGRPIMRLCVQCVERVPDADTVVMHKLMIEGSERDYLRVANRV